MVEFNGDIYVGTLNLRVPPELLRQVPRDLQSGPLTPIGIYESQVDTDGAEIWRYAPADATWTRVVDTREMNPKVLGFRNMVVFQGALFAGSLGAEGPAQVWSSPDGRTWSVALELTDANKSVRGMAVAGDRLYLGTENADQRAELWSFDGQSWACVSVFGNVHMVSTLTEMDGALYVGTWNAPAGFEVYRYDGAVLECVVSQSDHNPADLAVMSMQAFNGKLYVGTMNFAEGFSLYAYDPSTGELSLQAARGLGNRLNFYAWNLEVHQGRLYLGVFGVVPVAGQLLWSSADGTTWDVEMAFGFPGRDIWGVRSLLSVGDSLYMGTAANLLFRGRAEVWIREDEEN